MSDDGNGKLRGKWQGYTLDTDPEVARRLFEKRHGSPPLQVIVAGCILVAGPISGNGHQRLASPVAHVETPEAGQLTLELEA